VSPRGDSLWSPPVQDNVVARVLLEHVGGVLSQTDPRRTVNYLDLSKLGEEGETPASDEIWLSVAGGAEDDKFLTSDSETYSVATDKLSTAATLAGHVLEGQEGRQVKLIFQTIDVIGGGGHSTEAAFTPLTLPTRI